MLTSRRGSAPVAPDTKAGSGSALLARSTGRAVFGTLIAASISLSVAQAATFGHSRIVSAIGQPLHLEIPVTQLTQQEIDSLRAMPAPAEAWQEAGMTPPVALESMRLVLLDGFRPDVKVIQLRSDQVFDQPIVDVLLDVRSVSGQQRYQVSMLAHADRHAVARATEDIRHPRAIDGRGPQASGEHDAAGRRIQVRSGDNMFAIARRNAVQGVTVYQMMIALQRANQQAFIEDNVNLVKAGATLTMPGMDALTALSDREARRIFQQHAQAFARYGQRGGVADTVAIPNAASTAQGDVSQGLPAVADADATADSVTSGDRLRLSGAPGNGAAGLDATASGPEQATSGEASRTGDRAAAGNGVLANGQTQAGQDRAALEARASAGSNSMAGSAAAASADMASGSSHSSGATLGLLASSGVIASDAVSDSMPVAVAGDTANGGNAAFGSDAATGGTVLEAGNGAADPDDQAAMQKGVEESRARVLELEDNVRHLNEALQKQGHVAAEAALEGARSVSEAIKEVMSMVDPDEASEPVLVENGAAAATGSLHSGTGSDSPDATATLSDGSATGASPRPAAAASATSSSEAGSSATPSDTAPNASDAASSNTAASGGTSGSTSNNTGRTGSTSGLAATGSQTGQAVAPSESTQSTPSSVRTDKEVSWFQENLLAVIGGGLAFIVLLVVWLLRRASAAKRDIFESDSPITDSMVRDRLNEIDLDLDTPPSGGPGRTS